MRGLDGRRRLGDLWTRIDELLRDGYDHLVVVPHGPGHYLPWHLLGAEAQPLAERCAVSVLPNLALLQHGRDPGTAADAPGRADSGRQRAIGDGPRRRHGHLFARDRAFILKAMNQAVSRLYIQDDNSEQAA